MPPGAKGAHPLGLLSTSTMPITRSQFRQLVAKSPVSRVLSIVECVEHILSHLDRADLARCSRVQRSWTAASQYFLWMDLRDFTDIAPLARILGPLRQASIYGTIVRLSSLSLHVYSAPHACILTSLQCHKHDVMLSPDSTRSKFLETARLVRSLRLAVDDSGPSTFLNDHTPHSISTDTLETMLHIAKERKELLFPRIEGLELAPRSEASIPTCIRIVCSVPRLRDLRLRWGSAPVERLIIPIQYLLLYPNLRSLNLWCQADPPPEPILVYVLIRTLPYLPRLSTLALPTSILFEQQLWDVLAELPCLTKILLPMRRAYYSNPRHRLPPHGLGHGFARLRHLELEAHIDLIEHLLIPGIDAPIISLTIILCGAPYGLEATRRALQAICAGLPHLQTLSFTVDYGPYTPINNIIDSIFELHHLTHLAICSSGSHGLDDEGYHMLALALPQLESIILRTAPYTGSPAPTLQSLHFLAFHCRSLCSLSIDLRLVKAPADAAPFAPSLKEICFGRSKPGKHSHTAAKLVPFFTLPLPEVVQSCQGENQDYWKSWTSKIYEQLHHEWQLVFREVELHLQSLEV